ncbi:MAG: SCO family protein, partial [Winogradskyella sp.]|nr:SCO family protein [Winogradskyella sp.]
MSKKANYSYVGIAFIILVFGIIFIPKIINRISNDDITRDESRSEDVSKNAKGSKSDLAYLKIGDEPKKIPEFSFTDHNGNTITNEDYLGKVYVVEFFFTTCPTICPIMNRNLVNVQNHFKDFENFG